ncbi:MAG: hypothetical protein ACRBDX_11545 [Gammaproteobacteria bacterium]
MTSNDNRRSDSDRRISKQSASFPLRDSQGILVAADRRICADRRTNGLEVTESDLSKDEFNDYFLKFQNKI